MAATVPTREPSVITAGDTAEWTLSLGDYPASTFTLSYAMMPEGGGQAITFSGTASGDTHSISVSYATTLTWAAADYLWQAYVTETATGKRYNIRNGRLTVQPDYATAGQIDPRSTAKRILDFIDRSFERVVQKQVVSATIEGVQLQFRSIKELQDARNYWATIYAAEQGRGRKVILARFRHPAGFSPNIMLGQVEFPAG